METDISCKLENKLCNGPRGDLREEITVRSTSRGDIDKMVYCWKIRTEKTCEGKGQCIYY